jgi:phosphatidylserine decarboxylase
MLCALQDYRNYSNVNEWFTRHVRPGARPIAAPLDNEYAFLSLFFLPPFHEFELLEFGRSDPGA